MKVILFIKNCYKVVFSLLMEKNTLLTWFFHQRKKESKMPWKKQELFLCDFPL